MPPQFFLCFLRDPPYATFLSWRDPFGALEALPFQSKAPGKECTHSTPSGTHPWSTGRHLLIPSMADLRASPGNPRALVVDAVASLPSHLVVFPSSIFILSVFSVNPFLLHLPQAHQTFSIFPFPPDQCSILSLASKFVGLPLTILLAFTFWRTFPSIQHFSVSRLFQPFLVTASSKVLRPASSRFPPNPIPLPSTYSAWTVKAATSTFKHC